jgi:hypothetical protein
MPADAPRRSRGVERHEGTAENHVDADHGPPGNIATTTGFGISSSAPGDVTIATDLGVPRPTARGWLGNTPKVVVGLDVTDVSASALQQEVLELRRRVKKLRALLRLVLALLRSSGFTFTHERLPNRHAKIRILSAVDHAHAYVPLRV